MANSQERNKQELEAQIAKYRHMKRQVDSLTAARIQSLIEDLEGLLQEAKKRDQ